MQFYQGLNRCGSFPLLSANPIKAEFYWLRDTHHHQSVLPKGRSFTANSGTKAAVLPKGRSSTVNSETKVAVSLWMTRYSCFLQRNIYIYISSSECSAQGQVFHCKLRHQGCNSAQRHVFHRKLRNQGCSFTRDEQVQ